MVTNEPFIKEEFKKLKKAESEINKMIIGGSDKFYTLFLIIADMA
jgi:hypothetical protein